MLKKTVTFEDFNGDQQTDTLYFNLTKTEMMDLLELQPRLQKFLNLKGSSLNQEDTLEFFDIIKKLIKLSYGERSADGKHFRKSDEIFSNFESSAMYDAFTFNFIENPDQALEFMLGILPKGLDDEAMDKAKSQLKEIQSKIGTVVELPQPIPPTSSAEKIDEDTRPAWQKENRNPTDTEMRAMSKEEMQEAFRHRFTS